MNPETQTIPLIEQVGFDYIAALRELLQRFTYEEVALKIGYASTGSVTAVLAGRVPSHKHGEAIWALYRDTFGRKPPMALRDSACQDATATVKASASAP